MRPRTPVLLVANLVLLILGVLERVNLNCGLWRMRLW